MNLNETISSLAVISNLANTQLAASTYCQSNKMELMVGRDIDGSGHPDEETAVELVANEQR